MPLLFAVAALTALGYLATAMIRVKPHDPATEKRQVTAYITGFVTWIAAVAFHGEGTYGGQRAGWLALAACAYLTYRLHVDLSTPRPRPGSRLVTPADLHPTTTRRARLAAWLGIPDRRHLA